MFNTEYIIPWHVNMLYRIVLAYMVQFCMICIDSYVWCFYFMIYQNNLYFQPFCNTNMVHVLKSYHLEDKDLTIMIIQYHGWYPGDKSCQSISNHDIYQTCLEYSSFSPRRIDIFKIFYIVYQGCTKWRTRRTSPPQADFDRAKKWFQNQAEQTSSPARLINKWNKTYLIILNMNYSPYL